MTTTDYTILEQAAEWLDNGQNVAIGTVVQTWGSAPQPTGSQIAIDSEGNFVGSVSGGCIEGAVITEALDVMVSGEPKLMEFGVSDDLAWEFGLACGGKIKVYVEPLLSE
ncbi:MAG: XdhC family protein [Methyloligellaceae bacterium]